jgi:hypothetical protein
MDPGLPSNQPASHHPHAFPLKECGGALAIIMNRLEYLMAVPLSSIYTLHSYHKLKAFQFHVAVTKSGGGGKKTGAQICFVYKTSTVVVKSTGW